MYGAKGSVLAQSLGEMLQTCPALVLCTRLCLADMVSSSLFLLEQNKEVCALLLSCDTGRLLSVDCTQFSERKLRVTYGGKKDQSSYKSCITQNFKRIEEYSAVVANLKCILTCILLIRKTLLCHNDCLV